MADANLTVKIHMRVVGFSFWDALKLRLGGPELREKILRIVDANVEMDKAEALKASAVL